MQEVADRRTRPESSEKDRINARTSEALHELAGHSRHSLPRFRHRQPHVLSAEATGSNYDSADMLEDEETDDFGMADGFGNMEGARIDSSLYDVYNHRTVAPAVLGTRQMRLPTIEAHRPPDFLAPSSRTMQTFTNVFGPSHPPPTGGRQYRQRVARQHIARHPPPIPSEYSHPDFADFTARRRTARRQQSSRQAEEANANANSSTNRDMEGGDATPRPTVPNGLFPLSRDPYAPSYRSVLFDPPSPDFGIASPSLDGDDISYWAAMNRAFNEPASSNFHVPAGFDSSQTQEPMNPPGAPRLPPLPSAPILRRGSVVPPEVLHYHRQLPWDTDSGASSRRHEGPGILRLSDGEERDAAGPPPAASAQAPPMPALPQNRDGPVSLPTPRSVSPTEHVRSPVIASESSAHDAED